MRIEKLNQNTIEILLWLHLVTMIIAGFFYYRSDFWFPVFTQIAFVLIYLVALFKPDDRNKIIIQGILAATIIETVDCITGANVWINQRLTTIHQMITADAIILFMCIGVTLYRRQKYLKKLKTK